MGQSVTTPLTLSVDHWAEILQRARNLSVEVKKRQWKTICSSRWPTFNVGWPSEGIFNLSIILQVKDRVCLPEPGGHPDQVPYILIWEDLVRNPPVWVKPFISGPSPPPLPSPDPLIPSVPLLITSGPREGKRMVVSVIPFKNSGEQVQYWSFSVSDLYNWNTCNPLFSQDPQEVTTLLIHQPTWDDCRQWMQTLLTAEEAHQVLLDARENVLGANGRPTQPPNEIDEVFLFARFDWDYNTPAGRERLRLYRQTLVAGLRGAEGQPTNLAKEADKIHNKRETPEEKEDRIKREKEE